MTSTATTNSKAVTLIALALACVAMGLHVAYADDPSLSGIGPAGIGINLMVVAVVLGVMAARRKLPTWATRTALATGILAAVVVGILIHTAAIAAPLFAQPRDVPSVVDSAPLPRHAATVERARELVRAAVVEQNLPGLSVAVGVGAPSAAPNTSVGVGLPSAAPNKADGAKEGAIVWAEGFGWRDIDTRTPVTPNTRFNIGTAASAIPASEVARLGLSNTGADSATEWSPEHVGEPEEDFPGFTVIRHVVFRPIGLAPDQPLPGDRATFYVPRSHDNPLSGRRLMSMRALACCAGTMASYSTASDLVRVGMATGESVNGTLAGGMVMSLMTLRDSGIVVAVLSNTAHANTSALAMKIADAFAKQAR
jgi:hypothetical protein